MKDGARGVDASAKQMQKSWTGMIKNLLNVQQFVGQIIHYITFSIGVQMVMGIRKGLEGAVDSFKEFEKSIVDAVAISGYVGSAFDKAREKATDLAIELSKNTVFSANEVAKALYSVSSAGIDITKVTKNELLPILNYATATQSSLEDATYAVLTAIKAFDLSLEDSQKIVDTFTKAITSSFLTMQQLKDGMNYIAPIAGSLGISLEETTAALATLTDVGLSGASAGQRLTLILTTLLDPTEKGRKSIEGLGISMAELDPTTHSLVEILYKLRAASFTSAEAAELFRTRTAGAALTLIQNADEVAKYTAQLKMSAGVTQSVAKAQEDTLWASLKKVQNELTATADTVGKEFTPFLIQSARVSANVLKPALEVLAIAAKIIGSNFGKLASVLKILIPTFIIYKIIVAAATKQTMLFAIAQKLILPISKMYTAIISSISNIMLAYTHTTDMAIKGTSAFVASEVWGVQVTGTFTKALHILKVAFLQTPVGWFAIALGVVATAFLLLGSRSEKFTSLTIRQMALAAKSVELYNEKLTNLQRAMIEARKITENNAPEPVSGAITDSWDEYYKKMNESPEVFAKVFERISQITGVEVEKIREFIKDIPAFPSDEERNMIKAIQKALSEESKSIEDLKNNTKSLVRAKEELSTEYLIYEDALNNLIDTSKEYISAEKNLNDILREQPNNLDAISTATERYVKARDAANVSETNWLKGMKGILTAIRGFEDDLQEVKDENDEWITGGNLDEWVGILEDVSEAQTDLNDKESESIRLLGDQTEAVKELSRLLAEYGTGSDEVVQSQAKLNDIIKQRSILMTDISTLQTDINQKMLLYNAVINNQVTDEQKLTETEIDLLKGSKSLIDTRDEYIRLQIEELKLSAERDALDYAREHHLTIQQEKLKLFLEAQQKVFDIEEKRYKLRVDEDEQLAALFEKLAEEGVLNQEMIDAYTELVTAQGELLSMNYQFAQVMEDLTPEQRELVEGFLAGTVSLEELEAAGIQGIDTIIRYHDAQQALSDAVEEFGGLLGPLIKDLIDMGVVSADVAQAYYDWIDNASEVASANYDLIESQNQINQAMEGMLHTTITLASSLIGYGDNAKDLDGIYSELIQKLGLFNGVAQTDGQLINWLNGLYGTHNDSLNAFTDEEQYVAAALVQTAQQLGLYEEGMTLAQIATDLGVSSLTDLNNIAAVQMKDMKSYGEISEDLVTASESFEKATNNLTTALDTLRAYLETTTKEMTDYALKFDFANVFMNRFQGKLESLQSFLSGMDMDFSFDIATNWNNQDFYTFFSSLQTNGYSVESVVSSIDPSFNIKSLWEGQGFEAWYASLTTTQKGKIDTAVSLLAQNPILFKTDSTSVTDFIQLLAAYDPETQIITFNTDTQQWEITLLDMENQAIGAGDIAGKGLWESFTSWLVGIPDWFGRTVIDPIKNWGSGWWPFAQGGIVEAQKGAILKGPTPVLAGEKGDEAFIPLEGVNRKYGEQLLKYIIPKYYPELMHMQTGGIVGGGTTYGGDTNNFETYSINGPIHIYGVKNVDDFTEKLKMQYRNARK